MQHTKDTVFHLTAANNVACNQVLYEVKHRGHPSRYLPRCALLNFVKISNYSTSVAIKAGFHSQAVEMIYVLFRYTIHSHCDDKLFVKSTATV